MLLLVLFSGCGPRADQSAGVQLILSTAEPTAGTTFEVRFEQPMAAAARVQTETASPLLFDPPLAGQFIWTSTRSGVFTPSQPLALDTEYRIRLRESLTNSDGRISEARLRHTLKTPPFGVTGWRGPERSSNAMAEPEFRLSFNAEIRAEALSGRAGFASAEGKWIPAVVRQGTGEDGGWSYSSGGRTELWSETFDRQHPGTNAAPRRPAFDGEETNPIPNLVVVAPAQPLSVGHDWRLTINAGVGSADGRLQTREPFQVALGDVQAFTFTEATMHHVINREPYLELEFSKDLDSALTNSFTNWVRVSPWPAGVEARPGNRRLWLNGGWQRGTQYVVSLGRGLPSAEPFALGAATNLAVTVPPIDPRLYFPAFSTEQFAGGNRSFPLLAVNVPRVSLRAKLLDAATVIHALRGYAGYHAAHPWLGQKNEGYLRLDYTLVPGHTVFNDEIDGSIQDDSVERINLNWSRLLGGRKTGIVFLEAERSGEPSDLHPVLGTQALIQLTDLGLVWKRGNGRMRAFVFSYQTGQPAANVTVRLFADENEALGETLTDAQGQAELPITNHPTWLAAQSGEDLHAVRLHHDNIPLWSFNLSRRWHDEEDTNSVRQAVLFTDRDVYRPNETVQLKAIFRDLEIDGLSIPAGRTGMVACADAKGRRFFQTNFTLSALGSCSPTIPLPAGPTGDYQIGLALDGRSYSKEIQLAEFQPAAFEVRLQAKASYAPEEKIDLPLSARYFFGEPLTKARVHWSLSATDQPIAPEEFKEFGFGRCAAEWRFGRRSSSFSQSGDGQLEAGTNCVVHAEIPVNAASPQPRAVSVLAEVTDINQQTISRQVEFIRHSSEFYLGIKRPQRVLAPGKELAVELAAVAPEGQPWPQPVPAHVILHRVLYETVLIQGAGRTARYRTEASLTNVFKKEITVAPATKLTGGERGYRGSTLASLAPSEAGEYLLEVTARDGAGRETACSIDFSVTENASLAWDYRNEVEVKLVSDKTNYAAGESALLLVKAPFSGAAWVTVEREQVRRSFLTQLQGNAPSIRIPLEPGDAPNVFVSVILVRGAGQSTHQIHEPEYRVGYCELHVADPGRRLRVEVAPGRTNYQPGETITLEARVLDADGNATPDTEVILYAVDEGVLSLTEYQTPDLAQIFLAPRQLGVNSAISLPLLMTEDPERLGFQNKGYLGGGGGKEEMLQHLRKKFPACAFWNADLRTDAQGKVSARFTAPDSITRYRLMAVAHNASSQFGTGVSRLTVSKPLMIEPALPQFASLTDRLQARAIVFNQTAEAAQVRVTLQLDDKAVRGGDGSSPVSAESAASGPSIPAPLSRTLEFPANGSLPVDFPVVLKATGEAKWIWRAQFAPPPGATNLSPFTDAVESTLRVGHLAPLLREVVSLRAETPETNLLAALNPQLLEGAGTLSLDVANTRLIALSEAIRQLLHYPYGCVEQTSSSLLPWVLLRDNPALVRLTEHAPAEAEAAAHSGIQRLFTMQTASGGLSYWPGQNRPMFWGSAYGAMVLGLAQKSGLAVPKQEFDSLLAYLSKQLTGPGETAEEVGTQCLALYALALAGRTEPAWHTQLFERRERMSPEERALLALATATGEPSSPMAKQLLQEKLPDRMGAGGRFDSPARAKAVRLLAVLKALPGDPEPERIFSELLAQRKHGHWNTTQANAWVLLALHEQVSQTEAGARPDTGSLTWGAMKRDFALENGRGLFQAAYPLEPARSSQALRLAHSVSQPLFVQLAVESRLPAAGSSPQDHGFGLSRRYDRLDDQNQPQPGAPLKVGDRVLITLRLTVPEAAEYVALDDPLPAVLETVNSEFKTQQVSPTGSLPALTEPAGVESWWSDFQEIRAERMLFFRDELPAGRYVVRYVARVRSAGKATAPVAKIEEMYNPDRFGLTEAQPVSAEAGE